MKKLNNLSHKKIGRWLVLKERKNLQFPYRELYLCQCKCGKKKLVLGQNLRRGFSKSCGCFSRDKSWKGYGKIPGIYWGRLKADAKRGRKTKIVTFNLSIKVAWELFEKQYGICALSGLKLKFSNSSKDFAYGNITASLDRIDSNKGYFLGNVQWVHKVINKMKQNLTDKEFIYFCKKVSKYNG